MKELKCIEVMDYKDVGAFIEEYQNDGWQLHSYETAGFPLTNTINHYLLFEKGK